MITPEMLCQALIEQFDPMRPNNDAGIKQLTPNEMRSCKIMGSYDLEKMARSLNRQMECMEYPNKMPKRIEIQDAIREGQIFADREAEMRKSKKAEIIKLD